MISVRLVCFLLVLGSAVVVHAADEPTSINRTMTEIGTVMSDLFPLIVTRRALEGAEQNAVKSEVGRLIDLFKQAAPAIEQRAETYQVSYQLVIDQLEGIQRTLLEGDFDRGRSELYGLGAICASCHTQDARNRTLFIGASRARFPDDFSFAEFNYLTRNYDDAERYYDIYLSSPRPQTEFDVIKPLQRLVTIYSQIRNKPGEGAARLTQYRGVKAHSEETKKQLAGWIEGLKALEKEGLGNMAEPELATLGTLMERYVGDPAKPLPVHVPPEQEVARVWLRGQLYRYLANRARPDEVPNVLFWLAVTDRAIGYEYYFSLADLYLKDCVLNYSASTYAQRCFDEYKEYVNYAYSGSAGEFVPPEIETELEQLQRALRRPDR